MLVINLYHSCCRPVPYALRVSVCLAGTPNLLNTVDSTGSKTQTRDGTGESDVSDLKEAVVEPL